jgi:hypothetical protein
MAERKLTNAELSKLRRSIALGELELGACYPQTHMGIAMRGKRARQAIPDEESGKGRVGNNPDPPESVAKPWKEPRDK